MVWSRISKSGCRERCIYFFRFFSGEWCYITTDNARALDLKFLNKRSHKRWSSHAGKPVHFRKPHSMFSHCSVLQDQCLSIVVFIGERHVTRQQVQTRQGSYLLCQETNSLLSFMLHWDVLLGLWNIFWLIPGFLLHIMTQRHRVKKGFRLRSILLRVSVCAGVRQR